MSVRKVRATSVFSPTLSSSFDTVVFPPFLVYLSYLENRGDTDVRAVKSGQWEYMVDFAAMKQTNLQHQAHTVRDIRRVKNTGKKA
jgi:WWE domain